MARSDAAWIFGAVVVAASVVACSDLLGLGNYAECADACDAGADVFESGDSGETGTGTLDAPASVDAMTFDAMTFDAGEAGAIDAALYWAHWPMPNPQEVADADGLPNGSKYVVNAGVVVDQVTRLRWQTAVQPGIANLGDAMSYCATQFGPTWRVPTRIELVSLVDFARYDPAIDPAFIVNDAGALIANRFWTASGTWVVDFVTGEVTNAGGAQLVRCVSVSP
jgi:hypothetical protein